MHFDRGVVVWPYAVAKIQRMVHSKNLCILLEANFNLKKFVFTKCQTPLIMCLPWCLGVKNTDVCNFQILQKSKLYEWIDRLIYKL